MDTTKLNNAPVTIDVAESEEQIEKIRRFRISIEQNGNDGLINFDDFPKFVDDIDETSLQIFAESENKIVAAIRINLTSMTKFSDNWCENFGCKTFNEFSSDSYSFTSKLIVDPVWKGTSILGKILNAAYHIMKQKNIQFDFTDCAPSLVQFYEHLGYRRYKDNYFDDKHGYRVPMVLLVEDINHLNLVRSPFSSNAKQFENSSASAEWFKEKFPAFIGLTSERLMPMKQFWSFLANRLHEDIVPLLKDLSDEEVKRFLTSGVILRIKKGDKIVRKGDIGNEMFVLLSGAVDVRASIDHKEISLAVMGKGEIFGEMAFLSHTERSADVVALADCEVLVLTQAFLKKAMKMMPETSSKILFNLSLILCERLKTNNENYIAKVVGDIDEI